MAKLSDLQEAYNNPNVRKFLDAIASAEGVKHGYGTLFGNQKFTNFGAHPNIRKSFTQTNGKTNVTTAAGRYQFIKPTWDGLAQQYGFRDFSPRSQDLGAIALIAENGVLSDVMAGRFQNAAKKLGGTWASLPSSTYAQPKRSWDQFNKYLGGETIKSQDVAYEPEYVSSDLLKQMKNQKQYQPEYAPPSQPTYEPEYVPDSILAQMRG